MAGLTHVCKWMLSTDHGRTFRTCAAKQEALAKLGGDLEMDSLCGLVFLSFGPAGLTQVCKWMLSKGHGRTFGTYAAMLEALARLGRDPEMDSLWGLVLEESMEGTPRALFAQAMRLYMERQRPLKVLEVWLYSDAGRNGVLVT